MSTTEKNLEQLHDLLARKLKEKIESGEATAADMNVALGLLRHNNIQCKATPTNPLGELAASLPFTGMETLDEEGNPVKAH